MGPMQSVNDGRNFLLLGLLLVSLFIIGIFVKTNQSLLIYAATAGSNSSIISTAPRGAAAMSAFDQLPFIKKGTTVHQVSSYDRGNGNWDGANGGNPMYQDPATNGYVVMEEYKPGTIYRMWATGLNGGNIMVFFDGATTPAIDMPVSTFFSGTQSPFLAPLTGNDMTSSGGFYSYYPLSFANSVKVEFTNVPQYYNFTYHLYSDATGVTTYTGNEDMLATYNAWNNPTVDPKSTSGNQTIALPSLSILPGQTKQLANISGAGSIRSIAMTFPQFITTQYPTQQQVTDNGKAFTGSSSFMVKIDPNNQGIQLTRRLDYTIASQTANVLVNDQLVGQWSTPGNALFQWRDSTFMIPRTAIATGSSQMKVTIQYVSSQVDWNEFYYWVKSVGSNGTQTLTDTVDVGNDASELAHQYTVTNLTWSGGRTYGYPDQGLTTAIDPATIDILGNTWVQIAWDGETTPSVNVPLGFFYGLGTSGEGSVKGLLMGVDPVTHKYYNYFPMPYGKSAKVSLVNKSQTPIASASAAIQYNTNAFSGLGTTAGYFVANYVQQNPPTTGSDFHWATLSGTGQVVAEMLNLKNFTDLDILESDERVLVDQNTYNPQVHGTGTEDFFNGGWYFLNGDFTLPTQGNTIHTLNGATPNAMSMYRESLADAYPFEKSINFNIEHGSVDPTTEDHVSATEEGVVFAYVIKNASSLLQTDSLTVGNAASESAHKYVISGTPTWSGDRTMDFFGREPNSPTMLTSTGKAFTTSSTFTVKVASNNTGVRLARILDFGIANQKAQVFVRNGSSTTGTWQLAGTWFNGGNNLSHRFLYDTFEIPASLTKGYTKLSVMIQFVSSQVDWNEFQYIVYSHTPPTLGQ